MLFLIQPLVKTAEVSVDCVCNFQELCKHFLQKYSVNATFLFAITHARFAFIETLAMVTCGVLQVHALFFLIETFNKTFRRLNIYNYFISL